MEQFVPENQLRDHVNAITGRQCGSADLIEVMRLVRLILEHKALAQTYPHVSLYCDWLLHNEIDRHRLILSLLEKMNEAIASYDNSRDIASVSRLLSLADLRAELIVLFASYQIRIELLDSLSNWMTFVGVLLQELCNRPIRLPKKPSGKMKKATQESIVRMVNKWKSIGKEQWARAFFITLDRAQYPPTFSWNVEYEAPYLRGANKFVKSALQMTETAKDFRLA
jgi:hypothetical protein